MRRLPRCCRRCWPRHGFSGRQQEPPPATRPRDRLRAGRAHPGHGLSARRPPGSGAARAGQAVHRRLRRDGQAPRDSRGRDLQPHALLHRQGAGARADLRGAQVVRDRFEHGPEDGQPQGARGDRADVARSAGAIPLERQGGHDRGDGDGQAGTGGDRRLLRADAHQREPGGGHRAGSAVDCHGRRSGRPGGVRPKGQRVLRHPHQAERAIESTRQAGR